MCTKARAIALGCKVSGSYSDNQLVKYSDLSPDTNGIIKINNPNSIYGFDIHWNLSGIYTTDGYEEKVKFNLYNNDLEFIPRYSSTFQARLYESTNRVSFSNSIITVNTSIVTVHCNVKSPLGTGYYLTITISPK